MLPRRWWRRAASRGTPRASARSTRRSRSPARSSARPARSRASSTRSPTSWRNARHEGDAMLLILTLVTVAAVVLVLAGYLIAIAWALLDARRSVAAIADGLEAVAGHTSPLGEKL